MRGCGGKVGGVGPDGVVVITAWGGVAEGEAGGGIFGELEVEDDVLVGVFVGFTVFPGAREGVSIYVISEE